MFGSAPRSCTDLVYHSTNRRRAAQSGSAKWPRKSMSSMMATPPTRVWRRSAETKALGVGEVRQQKPRRDDIEQCVGLPLDDVLHLEHDIRQTESMRFPTSDVQLDLIEVDTHRSARRPSRPSEFEGHITAAAP